MSGLEPKERKKIQKRALQLRAEIERHDRLYYKTSQPEISDFEYDCLKSELLHLESLLPESMTTIGVGDDRVGNLLTRKHYAPMLSLENTYAINEILNFDARIRKLLPSDRFFEYVLEPKIDGLAVNLIYENGRLKYALTRGNGLEGEDVTDNIKTIEKIPLTIQDVPDLIEIRGEVYIDRAIFQKINAERAEAGEISFANARNLASGALKLMDSEEVRSRQLKFLAYGVGAGNIFEKQSDLYPLFEALGFQSHSSYNIVDDLQKISEKIKAFDEIRSQLPYDTDGVVFKLNARQLQESLGHTTKAPRWAFAYKFEPERAETVLKNIALQVGRSGVVTPIAELHPINLSGSQVARATLHNADDIAKKDIRVGDVVIVEKSGEIIPAVVGIRKECRPSQGLAAFTFPRNCPCCGAELVRLSEEVAWRCPNGICQEQIVQKVIYCCSKTALDIDGIGETIIRRLVGREKIKTIADVYHLRKIDFQDFENFGEKSVNRVLSGIEKSKKTTLDRWINALCIPFVGEKTSKDLAQYFKNTESLLATTIEELEMVKGIGQKIARSIFQYFRDKKNQASIAMMKDVGFEFEKNYKEEHPNFSRKIFALTGKLQRFSRREVQEIIEKNGGTTSGVVSKNIDILVIGNNPGEKLKIAQKYGITIWSEDDLWQKIQPQKHVDL